MPVIDLGSVVGPQGPQGVAGQNGAQGVQGNPGPNQVTGSTSTTLNGILQGNGSYVQAVASDNAPTAGSNNILRSGAVYNAMQRKINPNLLRNCYFVGGGSGRGTFPVNPGGKTTYSVSNNGWTPIGWYLRGNTTLTLQSDGMLVTFANDSTRKGLNMPLASLRQYLVGKTVTLSALIKDYNIAEVNTFPLFGLHGGSDAGGNSAVILGSRKEGNGLWTVTGVVGQNALSYAGLNFCLAWVQDATYGSFKVVAAKLEIGDTQTLAHEENGVWVLNEIPDYEEEELKLLYTESGGSGSMRDPVGNKSPATAEMIAPVESGSTASRQYATGKIFTWEGKLYKAKTTINSGVAFTEGTNCEQTTLAALLNL